MTVLLVVIYITFIGLGLPDSLLGSAWPAIQVDIAAPLWMAGAISMIISMGTVIASLNSCRLINKFGTAKVTLASVALTAAALMCFAFSGSAWVLLVAAVPLGLGAGSVDSALNNFVAVHYKAMHMSWLHCFWGVGATAGPVIISLFVAKQGGWKLGYLAISVIQLLIVVALFISMPLWKSVTGETGGGSRQQQKQLISNRQVLRMPNVKPAIGAFLFYCGMELMAGLWSGSFFVEQKGLSISAAAVCVSFFYGSITVGRFFSGFLTLRISNMQMIRIGQIVCVAGTLLMLLPVTAPQPAVLGVVLIGLGSAPIYPCMVHQTPVTFGGEASQAAMGLQIAFASTGNLILPPLLGAIATHVGIWILPYGLFAGAVAMLCCWELLRSRLQSQTE